MESTEYLFKIVLAGDWNSGKTSISYTYDHGMFPTEPLVRVGIDFWKKVEKVDGVDVNIQLWDQAGAARYWSTNLNNFTIFLI